MYSTVLLMVACLGGLDTSLTWRRSSREKNDLHEVEQHSTAQKADFLASAITELSKLKKRG